MAFVYRQLSIKDNLVDPKKEPRQMTLLQANAKLKLDCIFQPDSQTTPLSSPFTEDTSPTPWLPI